MTDGAIYPSYAISYFDALAYCAWLSKKTGLSYRLPTSLEWDKAARGVDGRAFPMGPQLEPSFAKLRESRPEASQPEPVGAFPLDVSPFGVRDMVGGVQDWTASTYDGGATPTLASERDRLVSELQVVIRGATWTHVYVDARLGRGAYRTSDRMGWVGFRPLVDFPTELESDAHPNATMTTRRRSGWSQPSDSARSVE